MVFDCNNLLCTAEHSRMAEAYALIEERLHQSVEEQYSLENQIIEIKVYKNYSA